MAFQVSKVAWTEVCLGVSQTTHDLYGLNYMHDITHNEKFKIWYLHVIWNAYLF
jgi:hypothetical protein